MKPQLINDNDKPIEEINFDIDFSKQVQVLEYIRHWSGVLVRYADSLPVGVL